MALYKNPIPTIDDDDNDDGKISNEADYSYKKEVYFAFIDVLGFKKAFDDHKMARESECVDKFREVFNYYFELMNSTKLIIEKSRTECYAGQTSDSLYFYTPRPDLLIDFIKVFLHFNLYAMSKGVFFRGGIAKGNLFIKDDYQFYGESVIYAYLLESSIARYPIIVVDENTRQVINDLNIGVDLVKGLKDRHYLNMFAFEEDDVKIAFKDPAFELKKIDYQQIVNHITENKKLFEYDAKNYEKYTFLFDQCKKLME